MRFFFSRCAAIVLFVLFFPLQSFAWNAVGHMVVANIAYERLKPEVRAKVDKMTMDLAKEYPNITQFQQLAPWPDSLRSQRIETFTHWHYIDKAFSTDNTPLKDLNDSDNVVWALKHIISIMGNNAVNPYEKARFLAFLVHMTGDIHQPLHTTSRISAQHPNGDQGGNQFAISAKHDNFHSTNLHSLWDGGVGVVDVDSTKENIDAVAHSITKHYPESYFGAKVHDLKPESWASEGFEVATKVVYNTPENQAPNTSYIETGKQTAEQRLALAGYRLAELLNQALDKK